MKIIEVQADTSTPEGRKAAMEEVRKRVQGMPAEHQAKTLEAAAKAIEAFAHGKTAMDVNLEQVASRLETMRENIEKLRQRLDDSAYIARVTHERTFWHGHWSATLMLAAGALHSTVISMRGLLEEEAKPEASEP